MQGSVGQNSQQMFSSTPNSIELNFNDESNNAIPISDSSQPIVIQLARSIDSSNSQLQFNKINATKMNFTSGQQLMINTFKISTLNSSVHIQLSPSNLSLAYLILLKLDDSLNLNASYKSYDYYQIMCPYSSRNIFFYVKVKYFKIIFYLRLLLILKVTLRMKQMVHTFCSF